MTYEHQLLTEAEVSFGVLGLGGEFTLFELTAPEPLDLSLAALAVEKGFALCGAVGLIDGHLHTAHEPDPDSWVTVIRAARAVAELLRLRHEARVSVEWCQSQYSLIDPR